MGATMDLKQGLDAVIDNRNSFQSQATRINRVASQTQTMQQLSSFENLRSINELGVGRGNGPMTGLHNNNVVPIHQQLESIEEVQPAKGTTLRYRALLETHIEELYNWYCSLEKETQKVLLWQAQKFDQDLVFRDQTLKDISHFFEEADWKHTGLLNKIYFIVAWRDLEETWRRAG